MLQVFSRFAAFVFALVACGAGFAFSEPSGGSPNTITGTAIAIDGDTITLGEHKVRLNGYDTPERDSMCGSTDVYAAASKALADFIADQTVTCELNGDKSYDRVIGTCSARGTDFGTFMVESGWGRDWKRFSGGKYAAAEKAARTDQRGLWGLNCSDNLWRGRNYDN
jgi:endonuclease YncB( thermonuclease family)